MNERVEEIRLDREGIAHFLNEQHQGWHDGMGSLSQTRVYGTALLLADAVRAALAQAERERDEGPTCEECGLRVVQRLCRQCHNAQCGVEEARAEVERLKREIDKVHTSNLMKALNKAEADLARVRAKVESLEFAIKDALHDLPDKGADAQITLRSALEGR